MNPSPVPILEVNPDNPADVELSFCPLEDLDDFLEDLSDDYELGFGELGALKVGKAIKKAAKVAAGPVGKAISSLGGGGGKSTVNNSCGALEIRWTPSCGGGGGGGGGGGRNVSVTGELIPQVRAALKTKFAPQVKAALGIKLAPKLSVKVPKIKIPKIKAKKLKAKLKLKAPKLKLPKVKLPKVKLPKVKLPKIKAPKISLKGPKLSLKGSVKFAPKLSLSAKGSIGGAFSPIPLDMQAVLSKCDAIRAAAKIMSLAPDVSKFSIGTKIALGAALKGTPLRGSAYSKPARDAVTTLRDGNVQCCVVAKSKAHGSGKTSQLAAKLKAKKRLKRGGPMGATAFQSSVGTLLDKIEAKSPTADVQFKVDKIRRLTGVHVRLV